MKVVYRILTLLLLLTCAVPAADKGPIYVIPVRTEISPSQFLFMRRALKEAERAGASAIVLDMDTYGGRLDSASDAMDALLKVSVPTYTYINSKALSAGSFIALATKSIYMAPNGVIGAAAPVNSGGQDLETTMKDKTVSAVSAMVRAAAQKEGHNPDLADSFIRKEAELKFGDVVIDRPDSLLTLDAQEAARKFDGKPVLAEGIAETLEEMLTMAGLKTEVRRIEPTGFERIAGFLTAIAPLLLMGGIIGAYVEIKTPGFGLPGILSTICFTLFFTGSYLAGLAGWEVMAVFLLGFGLIISELFVHPGTVLPGIIGFVLLLGSLVWAMVDRYPGQGIMPTNDMLLRPLINLVVAFVLAGIVIYFLAKYLPKTSIYNRIVLGESVPSGGLLQATEDVVRPAVGMEGTAHTMLRPSGKAVIDGQLVDVVSQGDLIPAGTSLRVLAVEGPRVVVAAAS
jgi:membrane-bound serine protease (ClpP class)